MKQSFSIAAVFVTVISGTFIAVAAGQGPPARGMPYQGTLQLNGSPVNGEQDFIFHVYDDATAGAELATVSRTLSVAAGTFAVYLDALPDAVYEAADVFVEVEVNGTLLSGRQRIAASSQSTRAEYATVAENVTVPNNGGSYALLEIGANPSGSVRIGDHGAQPNNDEGDIALIASGAGEAGIHHTGGNQLVVGNTGVEATTSIRRFSEVDLCPPDMDRVGTYCIEKTMRASRALASGGNASAMNTCHNEQMMLCPLEALVLCDTLNVRNTIVGSCGYNTDANGPARLLTRTVSTRNEAFGQSVFSGNNHVCYDPNGSGSETSNGLDGCNEDSSNPFFCCLPINVLGRAYGTD